MIATCGWGLSPPAHSSFCPFPTYAICYLNVFLLFKALFVTLCFLFLSSSDNRFLIQDYATRTMTQVDEAPQDCSVNVDHMFSLVLLENSEGKTKEFLLVGNTE